MLHPQPWEQEEEERLLPSVPVAEVLHHPQLSVQAAQDDLLVVVVVVVGQTCQLLLA